MLVVDELDVTKSDQEVKQEISGCLLNTEVEKEKFEAKTQVNQEISEFYNFETMQLRSNIGIPSLVNAGRNKSSPKMESQVNGSPKLVSQISPELVSQISPKLVSQISPKMGSQMNVCPKSSSPGKMSQENLSSADTSPEI